jgi:hypothetical protein
MAALTIVASDYFLESGALAALLPALRQPIFMNLLNLWYYNPGWNRVSFPSTGLGAVPLGPIRALPDSPQKFNPSPWEKD